MALNICSGCSYARILSLIETIDLRYVKEVPFWAAEVRLGFGDLHSGSARYLMPGLEGRHGRREKKARFAALGSENI